MFTEEQKNENMVVITAASKADAITAKAGIIGTKNSILNFFIYVYKPVGF
jgi:hypothetical protein